MINKKSIITTLVAFALFLFPQTAMAAQCPYNSGQNGGPTNGYPPVKITLNPTQGSTSQTFSATVDWKDFAAANPRVYSTWVCNGLPDLHIYVVNYQGNLVSNPSTQAVDDAQSRCNGSNNQNSRTFTLSGIPYDPTSNNYSVILSPNVSSNACIESEVVGVHITNNTPPVTNPSCGTGTATQNSRCIMGIQNECTKTATDLAKICKPGLTCDVVMNDTGIPGQCEPPNVTPSLSCPVPGSKCSGVTDTSCKGDTSCSAQSGNLKCIANQNGKFSCQGPDTTNNTITPLPTYPAFNTCANNKCDTALGSISTDPASFVLTLFKFILGISGVVALLLIIFSGYRLATGRNNPQAIDGARETLIAAIVGLLFVIFSVVILTTVGVDILAIPGITK